MSIIGTKVYSDYSLTQDVPQWAKLERYEYCEPFFDTISKKNHQPEKKPSVICKDSGIIIPIEKKLPYPAAFFNS